MSLFVFMIIYSRFWKWNFKIIFFGWFFDFNPLACKAACTSPCDNVKCLDGFALNKEVCRCYPSCPFHLRCQDPLYWDPTKCDCVEKSCQNREFCLERNVWSESTCSCEPIVTCKTTLTCEVPLKFCSSSTCNCCDDCSPACGCQH